jgi:predicted phage tail protein
MSLTNDQLTESLKNNQFDTLSDLLIVIKEMISNGSDLNATNEQIIVAKYKLSNIKELYQRLNSESSNDDIKQTVYKSVSSNQNKENNKEQLKEELTEDKFDDNLIPTTKMFGIISSVIVGGLMIFNGLWLMGLLYAIGGVMATLGLCVLLEGISTIIKLLRKISEK